MNYICNNCNFEGDAIDANKHGIAKNHTMIIDTPANRFIKDTYGSFEFFNKSPGSNDVEIDISNRTANSVNQLIRDLQEIYRDRVVAPLQTRQEIHAVTADLNNNMPAAVDDMIRTSRSRIASLIRLEVVKDNPYDMNTTEINDIVQQFMSRSNISESLARLQRRVISKLIDVYDTRFIDDLPRLVRDIAAEEFDNIRRIVVSETVTALNWGREQKYKILEQETPLQYKYRWNVHHDNRTTDECKEIERRIEALGGAVDLEVLKEIVREVGKEYNPNLDLRDWQPHINCRSVLERVVIRVRN